MCADTFGKRVVLDSIMDKYATDIGHGALLDLKWHAIDGMSMFLRATHQVMESFTVDHKSMLDLVPMSIFLLLKHCNDSEQQLQEINGKLVQEPVIIAMYLNPQIPKPTDPAKLKLIVDLVHNSLQRRYSAELSSRQNIEQEAVGNSLFTAMFQP